MPTVDVHQAKAQLSRCLALAEGGEEVVIARRGEPVARKPKDEQRLRWWAGSSWMTASSPPCRRQAGALGRQGTSRLVLDDGGRSEGKP